MIVTSQKERISDTQVKQFQDDFGRNQE